MDAILGTAFGGAKKAQHWLLQELNRAITEPAATYSRENSQIKCSALPWAPASDDEQPYERLFKEHILRIPERPEEFLSDTREALAVDVSAAISATAGAVLEEDARLRALRFRLVPKYISEEAFWRRYFGAVARARAAVLATEAAVDGDGLVHVPRSPECSLAGGSAAAPGHGQWLFTDPAPAPEGGQAPQAEQMVLSGHSETGAYCPPPAPHAGRPASAAKQRSRPAPQPVLSNETANSQCSSLTDAMVMSPRSGQEDVTSRLRDSATAGNLQGSLVASTQGGAAPPAGPEQVPLAVCAKRVRRLAYALNQAQHSNAPSMQALQAQLQADASGQRGARTGEDRASRHAAHAAHRGGGGGRAGGGVAGESDCSERMAVAVWRIFDPMARCEAGGSPTSAAQAPAGWPPAEALAGAPLGGLVGQLAAAAADLQGLSEIVAFWGEVVHELRGHWASRRPLPAMLVPAPPLGGARGGAGGVDARGAPLQRQLERLNAAILAARQSAPPACDGTDARPTSPLCMALSLLRPQAPAPAGTPLAPGTADGAAALEAITAMPPAALLRQLLAAATGALLAAAAGRAAAEGASVDLVRPLEEAAALAAQLLAGPLHLYQHFQLTQLGDELEVAFDPAPRAGLYGEELNQEEAEEDKEDAELVDAADEDLVVVFDDWMVL